MGRSGYRMWYLYSLHNCARGAGIDAAATHVRVRRETPPRRSCVQDTPTATMARAGAGRRGEGSRQRLFLTQLGVRGAASLALRPILAQGGTALSFS